MSYDNLVGRNYTYNNNIPNGDTTNVNRINSDSDEEILTFLENSNFDLSEASIQKLKSEFKDLGEQSKELSKKIEAIIAEIKSEIFALIDKQDDVTDKEKERVEEVVAREIQQFKKDRQNGKNVSIESLQASIELAMLNSSFRFEMSALQSQFGAINRKIQNMDVMIGQLASIGTQMSAINSEIKNADAGFNPESLNSSPYQGNANELNDIKTGINDDKQYLYSAQGNNDDAGAEISYNNAQVGGRSGAVKFNETNLDVMNDTLETFEAQMTSIDAILGFDEDIIKGAIEVAVHTGTYEAKKTLRMAKKAEQAQLEAQKAEEKDTEAENTINITTENEDSNEQNSDNNSDDKILEND